LNPLGGPNPSRSMSQIKNPSLMLNLIQAQHVRTPELAVESHPILSVSQWI